MLWQEEQTDETFVVPQRVIDLAFQIRCPTLPVDHAWALREAIREHLPWFTDDASDDTGADLHPGLHLIHCAESGNGWQRPQDGVIHLSRRTPLVLRLAAERVEDARRLSGQVLRFQGYRLELGDAKPRPLERTNTLYARHLAAPSSDTEPLADADEAAFLAWAIGELQGRRLAFKKVLCGRQQRLHRPQGDLFTRSLMVADLTYSDAARLQELGLGPHRTLGCGLFIPHKRV
jgi:CRISPR-associated protein Cas6